MSDMDFEQKFEQVKAERMRSHDTLEKFLTLISKHVEELDYYLQASKGELAKLEEKKASGEFGKFEQDQYEGYQSVISETEKLLAYDRNSTSQIKNRMKMIKGEIAG